MTTEARLRIVDIETQVCDIVSTQLQIPRNRVSPTDRLIEDLHCDSVDLLDLLAASAAAVGPERPSCAEAPFAAAAPRQPEAAAWDFAARVAFPG